MAVTQQPQARIYMVDAGNTWSSGLLDCAEDPKTCLCVLMFGQCLICKLSKVLGEHPCVPMCVPGGVITLRTKMRLQNNIQGSICDDCCKMEFCWPFALGQMIRHAKATGIWDGSSQPEFAEMVVKQPPTA